jgi:pre-mRNA-processing factor SLU7
MSHDVKGCMERPRKTGAKWTNKRIAADEKVEIFELDYDGKRDRWNGYDPATYARVIDTYEMRDDARRKYQKEQQMKKLESKNSVPGEEAKEGEDSSDGDDDEDDDGDVDEAKVDESKQMDFAKVEKRVRTTGGGSTGTVRYVLFRYTSSYSRTYLFLISMSHYVE